MNPNPLMQVLCIALDVYYVVLLVRIILSWVPSLPEPVQPVARGVRAVTDPLLNPLRGVLPPVRIGAGALDLSPLILFFGIIILRALICPAGAGLF
ncbi:MAG TPA: YggT family protein [Egibacteraceae bacterium]|jgi:YggT family protein|nr:YggT family protein [Egibacteraceae bacterium]